MCVSHPVPGSAVRLTDWAEPEPSSAGCLHTAPLLYFLTIALSIPLFLPPSLPSSLSHPRFLLLCWVFPLFLLSSLRIFLADFHPSSLNLSSSFSSFLVPSIPFFLSLSSYLYASFFSLSYFASLTLFRPLILTFFFSSALLTYLPPYLPYFFLPSLCILPSFVNFLLCRSQ